MPLAPSAYRAPKGFSNPHFQTAYARAARRVKRLDYERRRVATKDDDFIDLDTVLSGSGRVAILCHGLESCSQAPYMHGMGQALRRRGWDVVAMNFRGCSGEPNRLLRSYHSGVTEDLEKVVAEVQAWDDYPIMALVGFSLGGNVALKWASDYGTRLPASLKAVVGVSVPADLKACAEKFAQPANRFYMRRFLNVLQAKMRERREAFPNAIDYEAVLRATNFHEFDAGYTAPVHGFASAEDYWNRCSCRRTINELTVPALVLNAADDPFLSESCHLREEAVGHRWLHAETPAQGGHVGFVTFGRLHGEYYSETRVADFLQET